MRTVLVVLHPPLLDLSSCLFYTLKPAIAVEQNSVPFVNGVREAVCQVCVERANPLRVAKGLEPIRIFEDYYGPIPEEEL